MPDDVGGGPFPDGWEPDDDRGGADEDFASVVFDEAFVGSATFHEPTAVERLLAAAEARADAEAARSRSRGGAGEDELYDELYGRGGPYGHGDAYEHDYDPDDPDALAGPYGRHGGALRPYRGSARWHRPVAWLLALLMGIGMVALAFSAVYRGSANGRQDQVPSPATTGIDKSSSTGPVVGPKVSTSRPSPVHSAVPRTP